MSPTLLSPSRRYRNFTCAGLRLSFPQNATIYVSVGSAVLWIRRSLGKGPLQAEPHRRSGPAQNSLSALRSGLSSKEWVSHILLTLHATIPAVSGRNQPLGVKIIRLITPFKGPHISRRPCLLKVHQCLCSWRACVPTLGLIHPATNLLDMFVLGPVETRGISS